MANIKKDRDEYLSESAHISRDQVGELFLQTEPVSMPIQEEDRVPLIIDASNLNEDELAELRIIDPFLYYSIPSVKNASLRGSLTSSSQGSGLRVQQRRQSAPAALTAAADAAAGAIDGDTQVRRKSRISFELSFDAVMSDIIGGLDVGGDADDDADESFDDFLDLLFISSRREVGG